jgi:hypothetical protein
MLRIDRRAKALKRLEQRQLPQANLTERYDIQQMIRNSPEEFFTEMGEKLLLLGEEVHPTDFVDDRIDLLAIDPHGATVIIELKRGTHKLQLLQALAYAAMMSKWDRAQLVSERSKLTNKPAGEVEEEIEQFLLDEIGDLNQSQRILLLAEDFEYEVLVTAEWLTEQYDFDIRCYRLTLSADERTEFLTCICIFPPPEITQHAIRRTRRTGNKPPRYTDWEQALAVVTNKAVADFFCSELAAGRENYLPKRNLRFRLDGKRRLNVAMRHDRAYVWQIGRFKDDVHFWTQKLGAHIDIKPVRDDQMALRFFLKSAQDFTQFMDAFKHDLPAVEFLKEDDVADEAEE